MKKQSAAAAFRNHLFEQTPTFDKVFMDDWSPLADPWIGTVHTTLFDREQWLDDRYFDTLRAVRRISEGPAYRDWNPIPTFKESKEQAAWAAVEKFFEGWPK